MTDPTQARPLFSVVIPAYNRADRIAPVLKAVADQDFADFECLVVDDGSKDGALLEQVVTDLGDPRFVYIHQENGGACKARNTGFDAARGAYIALLDSDDIFLPRKLAVCAETLKAHPSKDVLIYSRMIVDRGVEKQWVKPPRGLAEGERVDEYLMCTAGWIQSSTMVLPTDLARRVRFDEALPSSQDTDFAIRVANAGAEVVFIEEPLIILDDVFSDTRVSKQGKYQPLLDWIETMRGTHISDRAYWAYRGWQCARVASYSNRLLAIRLYLASALRGVYPFKQAMVIAAQVLIPRRAYQKIATRLVALFGRSDSPDKKSKASLS
ncbi:glycosyltransferase family 2 protein [Pseudooceanicola algae]|uniref:Glycosyltransferase 2-like domain-containing protein n=1 Tax=Pseudooceanicola algae TaxID=1537215 RepID=A0A418SDB7_9RHOB|nr:glycosyltransferase family 2 protein [Pseudooceanicola algae]QPM92551.1 hypothetical protein PSAL_038150 [Pseudooceanicola algae]